jgi:hypothetical protein
MMMGFISFEICSAGAAEGAVHDRCLDDHDMIGRRRYVIGSKKLTSFTSQSFFGIIES